MIIQSWREKVKNPPAAPQKSTYRGQESGVEAAEVKVRGKTKLEDNTAECQLTNHADWGSRVMTISVSDGKIIWTCVYHRHRQ